MRLKTSLIQQQGVMIPSSETPVLYVDHTLLAFLPQALNFLRSEVPSVQLLLGCMKNEGDIEQFKETLQSLTLSQERFDISWPVQAEIGTVITLTRIVEPNVEETIFEKLKLGDQFFFGLTPELRGIAVQDSSNAGGNGLAAVLLNGEKPGFRMLVAWNMTVFKIIE